MIDKSLNVLIVDDYKTMLRIIRNLLDVVTENYQKSWAPVHPLTFEFVRSEMHTQFASIATPSEVVVVSSFRIELGSVTGSISMCIEPLPSTPITCTTKSLAGVAPPKSVPNTVNSSPTT